MRDDTKEEIIAWSGETSARYPDSDVMKYVVVNDDIRENICDLLETRYNGVIIGFDEESVNG